MGYSWAVGCGSWFHPDRFDELSDPVLWDQYPARCGALHRDFLNDLIAHHLYVHWRFGCAFPMHSNHCNYIAMRTYIVFDRAYKEAPPISRREPEKRRSLG